MVHELFHGLEESNSELWGTFSRFHYLGSMVIFLLRFFYHRVCL